MSDTDSEVDQEEVEVIRNSSSETSYDEEEETLPALEEKGEGTLVAAYEEETAEKMAHLPLPPPQPRRKRFLPNYQVEGVHRLVVCEETQLSIEILIGTHVNGQYPWKEVSKAKIVENIETLGEASEFYNIREDIEAYEDEMILMGYLVDESNDLDEFFVCCTKEARDHCKQQSDKFIRRQEKKLEKAVQKKPRPWTTLGSEKEIIELRPVNTRPLMEIEIKSKFPTVYDPERFKIRDTNSQRDGYIELTPYRQKYNLVFNRRIDTGIQAGPSKADRHAQTDLKYPKNMWTQSIADQLGMFDEEAGGDDGHGDEDDDDSSDDDQRKVKREIDEVALLAYRNAMKRMRRPSYTRLIADFMKNARDGMNDIVELNTVMDIYCNDYPNLVKEKATSIYDSMTFEEYVCFTDVRAKNKYVSSAVFHPMWTGIIAMSYADGSPNIMKFVGTSPDPIKRAVYGLNPVMIWSHVDSLMPKLYLESPREVKVLSFCPFDENILIGGCVNGQIVLWDIKNKLDYVEKIEVLSETREKYRITMNAHLSWMKSVQDNAVVQATALSALLTSHYGPVTSIKWLSPNFIIGPTGKVQMVEDEKKSMMILTASEDGTILVWNLSVENITLLEKKAKKSKRVPIRPVGLSLDVSPFKVLDRNLHPCFKIILGIAGQSHILPVQSLTMSYPYVKYICTPRNTGTGRKYFTSEIQPQTEDDICDIVYCGSMHGELMRLSWEGHQFNTGEMVNSEYCLIKYNCCLHDGVVTTCQKNPFSDNITLTAGGKIFAIWSDELSNRPIIWKKRPYRLTDAAWSLYKASLIFITTAEGTLETWDFILRSDQPISVQTLSGTTLTGVSLHTLPIAKNVIGVGDSNGSFKMFLDPPIFMIENPNYVSRMQQMIARELKVKLAFKEWQDTWMKKNPHVLLEIKHKEATLLAEKEEEKRLLHEAEEKIEEEEAEARRLEKLRVIGPAERWEKIIQKLIEKTIAVKKRINRQELIEQEKPLRELETQRLEKERRMLDIMKNQKAIFNDTVAILFPEAIKKQEKVKKSLLSDDKEKLIKEYLEDFEYLKYNALKNVTENSYKAKFSWDATLSEGKERRQALTGNEQIIKLHKTRLDDFGIDISRQSVSTRKNEFGSYGVTEDLTDDSSERDLADF